MAGTKKKSGKADRARVWAVKSMKSITSHANLA